MSPVLLDLFPSKFTVNIIFTYITEPLITASVLPSVNRKEIASHKYSLILKGVSNDAQ